MSVIHLANSENHNRNLCNSAVDGHWTSKAAEATCAACLDKLPPTKSEINATAVSYARISVLAEREKIAKALDAIAKRIREGNY